MNIKTEEKNGYVIVRLDGEVDLQTSPEVRKALLSFVDRKRNVVVSLGEVEYIDSSGVASLVEAYQSSRKKGCKFSLADVSASAMRVLQLARLDKVFTIHATLDDAVAG
ncbi:MAG: anti-anti-sigma factor [Alphaproteobacteria bacterium RIFOXYD12_FULL_60_8]|nr:MAG: anti-anti-sigma factor [Alphaproteobacteria bacterium RIFOXYD12_FULL_60_8]